MPFSPSIVPLDEDRDVYLVLDQLGLRYGRVWRETDEEDTDFKTVIRQLLEGQYTNPFQVVAFNPTEGWSRDVSDDIADELRSGVRTAARCRFISRIFWSVMIPATPFSCHCQFEPEAKACRTCRLREKNAIHNLC